MKKIIELFIIAILFSLPGFTQIELEKISLLDNKLELQVPKYFTRMTEEKLALLYPQAMYKPKWAITGEDNKVSLASAYTNEEVDDNGIPAFTDKLIAEMKAARKDFKLMDDGILLQDGKNIGYIKFLSQVKGQKVFNYMFYISLEDRLVLFSFECPKKMRKKWEAKAEEIAASLRLLP